MIVKCYPGDHDLHEKFSFLEEINGSHSEKLAHTPTS